jgi:Fe-S-cluster-containing dehydrogenase component
LDYRITSYPCGGGKDVRVSISERVGVPDKKKVAAKCNLYHHRVGKGLYPACAYNICLAHCIYFGDPAEIEKQTLEK